MGKFLLGLGGGALVVVLIVAVICIAPMLFLWSVNSLAELGGANFYIEHSLWSYWVSLSLIMIFGVSRSST